LATTRSLIRAEKACSTSETPALVDVTSFG
jgi:hypothetical protein